MNSSRMRLLPAGGRRRLLPIGYLLLLLLVACTGGVDTAVSTVSLAPCQLAGNFDAQCGSIAVPENREMEDGRLLDIHFAVVPATSSIAEPDPVFLLAGGPGQSAIESLPVYLSFLGDLNQDRDIVLVDQRGTGQSNPLDCPGLLELELEAGMEEVRSMIEECRIELAEKGDLTQYVTDIAMADLDAVRMALGYDQINLIGTSYGTRAALAYARLYPDQLRSMVLNSTAGPDLLLQVQAPRDGERALQMLFDRCASDTACERFPDLEMKFDALRSRLAEGVPVSMAHPVSGELLEFTLDEEAFMSSVFTQLYSADLVSLLPLQIQRAYETDDFGPLLAGSFAVGTAGIYRGMFYAVVCSEDAPLIDLDVAAEIQNNSRFPLQAADLVDTCESWPRADIPTNFRRQLESDIPTLLISGEADPITPPTYADAVAASLENSRHLIVPGYGHDVLIVGCMPGIITRFVDTASPAEVDADCLDKVHPPAFFVDLTGPQP